MDLTGKEIVAPKYRTVGDFHEGLAFFQREYDNVNLKD
ncbi:MAG: WG repeat-containing protein [Candidatus Obscuribacterales bacterium]